MNTIKSVLLYVAIFAVVSFTLFSFSGFVPALDLSGVDWAMVSIVTLSVIVFILVILAGVEIIKDWNTIVYSIRRFFMSDAQKMAVDSENRMMALAIALKEAERESQAYHVDGESFAYSKMQEENNVARWNVATNSGRKGLTYEQTALAQITNDVERQDNSKIWMRFDAKYRRTNGD